MALSSSILEPYEGREPRLVVALTTVLVFLDGIVTLYHTLLVRNLGRWLELSAVEWAGLVLGSFLVEPVLLFVTLYYVSRRFDHPVPLVELLPGLVVAVVVGSLLGDVVGVRIWRVATPLSIAMQSNLLASNVQTLYYWQEIVGPLVRHLLTAVAALGLARS